MRQTRRKLFGLALPDLSIFGSRSDKEDAVQDEVRVLETAIAAVRPIRGNYVATTADGAEWLLDEIPSRLMSPKVRQSLEVWSGALRSYFRRNDGRKGVKGRRAR